MSLRPGTVTRLEQDRGFGAAPSGVVLANDGTNLILADSLGAAWLNESSGNFIIDDAESNRDGGFFTNGTEIELVYG